MKYFYLFNFLFGCLFLYGCNFAETKPEKSFRQAEIGAYAADISVDGKLSVVSGVDNGINVWQLPENKPLFHWGHKGDGSDVVANIHISADSKYVVTSDREAFALWSVESGEPEGFWRIDESSIRDVAVSNNGRVILVGRANGKVMVLEPYTGRRLEFLGHQERINSIDISPNGKFALTGGNDYVAYLWNTQTGQVIHTFSHSSRVSKVALDDKGRYLFTADSKQKSQIWNAQTGEPVSSLQYMSRQKIFTDAVFSEDGSFLLTGSPSRNAVMWNVKTGENISSWKVAPRKGPKPATALVYAVGFAANNQVVTVSSSGLAEFWNQKK